MFWNGYYGNEGNKSSRNNIKGSAEAGKHKFTVAPITCLCNYFQQCSHLEVSIENSGEIESTLK